MLVAKLVKPLKSRFLGKLASIENGHRKLERRQVLLFEKKKTFLGAAFPR